MNHEQILTLMFSAYPNAKVQLPTAAIYLELLSDIPTSDLEIIVKQLIADGGDFVPSVSAIRRKWHELTTALDHPTPAEAWGQVYKAMQEVGHTGWLITDENQGRIPDDVTVTFRFRDAIVTKTVLQIGWKEMCASDNLGVLRAQFERMYASNLERKTSVDRLLPDAREAVAHRRLRGPQHIGGLLSSYTSREEVSDDDL